MEPAQYDDFVARATTWLEGNAVRRPIAAAGFEWGGIAGRLLGPAFTADAGGWGTYSWARQRLGAPSSRIAGGTDEVQHNIVGERVLGLPKG